MGYLNEMARDFARHVTGLGFRVYLAKDGTAEWGFITDESGARVLSFSMNDGGVLSGNYGPPSSESGTGWRMGTHPGDLRTADDVRRALYAHAPEFAGKGWKSYTTAETYLRYYNAWRFAEWSPAHD